MAAGIWRDQPCEAYATEYGLRDYQMLKRARLAVGWGWLPWVIITVGLILRVAQYAANRSLWLDESALTLNIVDRSWEQLWLPLDYNQGAPIGFLLIEKLAVHLLGNNEYALRLFPLLSGLAVLVLFYAIAQRRVRPATALIGVGLVVVSSQLIYYSSEVKQYSSDAAIGLLLIAMALYADAKPASLWRAILLGLSGAAALWFSHPAVFVLAGLGAGLFLFRLRARDKRAIGMLALSGLMWGLSFVLVYVVSLAGLSRNSVLNNYWQSGFMPLAVSRWRWYLDTFLGMFDNPVGLPLAGLAAVCFIAGLVGLWRSNRKLLAMLMLPLLATLAAAAARLYPFSGRLILFLVPLMALVIAEGVTQLWTLTRTQSVIIGGAIILLLFAQPVVNAADNLMQPKRGEDIRPAISYIRQHWQEGDQLYVYYGARPAFMYYDAQFGFGDNDTVPGEAGRDNWSQYWTEIDRVRGRPRVWLLFSHVWQGNGVDEEKLFLFRLNQLGQLLDAYRTGGAAAYLYDLSSK